MDLTLFAAFVTAAVPTFFTPGPNNLMLMASSAKFGFRRTLPHMIGIWIGFPLMVFVVGLGLGEIFTAYPMLRTILKWVAAAYFLWMAWTLLGLKVGQASARERPLGAWEAGLFQWVNPKAWAMAVSFGALFVVPGEQRLLVVTLLTVACLAVSPLSSMTWMLGGQQLDRLLKRTGTERFLGLILALLMVVAVVLFLL